MDDWNVTRNFTLKVGMAVQQPIAVGGILTAFLVSEQKRIKDLTYPNPTVGSNGNSTYITIRFDRQDIRPRLRSERFLAHAVDASITFKGSFSEDVDQILNQFKDVVHQLSVWFLANFEGWTDIKGNPVPLVGKVTVDPCHISDSPGLMQATCNLAFSRATKMMQVTAEEEAEELESLRGETLCGLMILDIIGRILESDSEDSDEALSISMLDIQ